MDKKTPMRRWVLSVGAGSLTRPLMLLVLLVGLFAVFYESPARGDFSIHPVTDTEWDGGFHRGARPGIAIDFFPHKAAIDAGTTLRFDNGQRRTVQEIGGDNGPLWQIWLDGDPFAPDQRPSTFKVIPSVSPVILYLLGYFLIFSIGVLATFVAYQLLSVLRLAARLPGGLLTAYGASYFLGIALLLFTWRLLNILLHDARLSLLSTCLLLIIASGSLLYLRYRRDDLVKIGRLTVWYALAAFLAKIYFLFFWVSISAVSLSSPQAPIGPFESGRYANISSFIVQTNDIPVLRQNYGQSILSAIPSFVGLDIPRLSLIFWLSLSVASLLFLIVGLVAALGGGRRTQIFVALIALVGGPRLTLVVTQLTDNHSVPILYNAYADTILGLGGLLAALMFIFAEGLRTWRNYRRLTAYAVIGGLLAGLWAISGFQFLVTLLFICFVLALARLFKPAHGGPSLKAPLALAGAAVLVMVISLPYGGMLTPAEYFDPSVHIRGVLKSPSTAADISLQFHSTYNIMPDPSLWRYRSISPFKIVWDKLQWRSVTEFSDNILALEFYLWDFVRSLFFVLVGAILFRAYLNNYTGRGLGRARFLLLATLSSLAIGAIFSSTIVLKGNIYWQLLRFMNAGYFLGMLLLGLGVAMLFTVSKNWLLKSAFAVLVFLSCAGPVAGITQQIIGSYRMLSFSEKINVMVSIPPVTLDRNP